MKEVTGNDPSQEELERNFEIMDEDMSGDIDKEEALKFLKGFRIGHALKALMNEQEWSGFNSDNWVLKQKCRGDLCITIYKKHKVNRNLNDRQIFDTYLNG